MQGGLSSLGGITFGRFHLRHRSEKIFSKGSECCQIKQFVILPRVNQNSICRQRLRDGKSREEEALPGCSKALKREFQVTADGKEVFFVEA